MLELMCTASLFSLNELPPPPRVYPRRPHVAPCRGLRQAVGREATPGREATQGPTMQQVASQSAWGMPIAWDHLWLWPEALNKPYTMASGAQGQAQNWLLLITEQHRYQGVSYKSDIVVVSGLWHLNVSALFRNHQNYLQFNFIFL